MASSWGKPNAERWQRGFAALSKFRAREGHCCPSRHYVEGNFQLGQWVSVQRYRKDFLPAERKRRLDAIGFVWDWRDDHWAFIITRLHELACYALAMSTCPLKLMFVFNCLGLSGCCCPD
jgi:hypothetical protein